MVAFRDANIERARSRGEEAEREFREMRLRPGDVVLKFLASLLLNPTTEIPDDGGHLQFRKGESREDLRLASREAAMEEEVAGHEKRQGSQPKSAYVPEPCSQCNRIPMFGACV